MTEPTNLELGVAAAHAILPLTGPQGALADQLLTAGLAFWADFQARKTAGTLTMADLEAAAAKTAVDLAEFKATVEVLPE